MNDEPTKADDADVPDLPPRLRADLSAHFASAVEVPPALDAAILSRAKAGYARRTRFRPIIRWLAAGGAVAAAVTLVFLVRATFETGKPHLAKGDVDGSGRVDVLDAYLVAQRLASGKAPERAWDVNGDGVIDQKDVDWIAAAAVRIAPEAAVPASGGAPR